MSDSNLSIRSLLCKEVDTNFQKFRGVLTKPQHGNSKEMALGLLETGSIYLSHIGKKVAKEMTPRDNTERYSRSLQGMDVEALSLQHIRSICRNPFPVEQECNAPVLLIPDGGDLQKPNGRKMEKSCPTVDGSKGHKKGYGYPTIGLVAYGTKSKETKPLAHHVYSTNDSGPWMEQKAQMERLKGLTAKHHIIVVEDRIGDDAKRINYYKNDLECGFVIRTMNLRKFDWQIDGKLHYFTSQDIAANLHSDPNNTRTYRNRKLKKTFTSRIAFTPVTHQELVDKNGKRMELTLVVIYTACFDEPMTILTDRKIETTEDAWTIYFYYKSRWEVEKFFRETKQMFSLESFLIRDFNAIQALVVLVLIVYWLAKNILSKILDGIGAITVLFNEFCRKEQRDGNKVSDLLAFCRHILIEYPASQSYHFCRWRNFVSRSSPNRMQCSMFDFRRKVPNL